MASSLTKSHAGTRRAVRHNPLILFDVKRRTDVSLPPRHGQSRMLYSYERVYRTALAPTTPTALVKTQATAKPSCKTHTPTISPAHHA